MNISNTYIYNTKLIGWKSQRGGDPSIAPLRAATVSPPGNPFYYQVFFILGGELYLPIWRNLQQLFTFRASQKKKPFHYYIIFLSMTTHRFIIFLGWKTFLYYSEYKCQKLNFFDFERRERLRTKLIDVYRERTRWDM